MANKIKLIDTTEIVPGSMKTVSAEGKRFAVANIDGEFFAIDDLCSHANCSLGSNGFLEGIVVFCGCHGAQFDVTTGDVLSLPATNPVASYVLTVENGAVYIEGEDAV